MSKTTSKVFIVTEHETNIDTGLDYVNAEVFRNYEDAQKYVHQRYIEALKEDPDLGHGTTDEDRERYWSSTCIANSKTGETFLDDGNGMHSIWFELSEQSLWDTWEGTYDET